jgi:nitroimidazol reductase NimA-like FMN-containing flavoprotein (pyridoxamine 5'-phosphate oxidase superfamily)
MRIIDERTGIEVLEEAECVRLLQADEIGRLAVIDVATPAIFPVNYVMHDGDIVFRTDAGTKLDRGQRANVCFEVDAFDRAERSGWSVVVTGRLEEITSSDSSALAAAQALPIHPWAAGERAHWVKLVPARITGRRVTHE